jgi:hypothetical protein
MFFSEQEYHKLTFTKKVMQDVEKGTTIKNNVPVSSLRNREN